MRYTLATETYPPEVNGVALTVHGLELGLRERGHAVALVRPRQPADDGGADGTLLVRGAGLPRYPGLRFGLPATRMLRRQWRQLPIFSIVRSTDAPTTPRALPSIPICFAYSSAYPELLSTKESATPLAVP